MADLITIGGELVTSGGDLAGQTYQQTALHEIAFHNTSGITSTGLVRFGVAFEDGDIPSGQTARVRIKDGANVRSHAIETTTYASGSLRKATMVADIGTVSGSGSTTIEVYNAPGSVAASSFDAPSWVSGSSDDLVCEIRSRTGSSSGALGNLDTSLKTAFGTPSRIFTVANCDLFYRVWVWEKLSGEEHLTPIIHTSWWLDTDGSTVKALELVPVLSQHWWVDDPFSTPQTKELQTYDATWKWGTTTIDNRTSLVHAYYNQWASLRSDDDAQHARPHWIDIGSTPMPTLRAVYADQALYKMMRSGVIPPYDISVAPSHADYPTTYAPLTVNGMSTGINSTGAHAERGLNPITHSSLIMDQSETRWRQARVTAQAAMNLYCHVRDHRTADSFSDVSMGIIPGPYSQLDGGTHTWAGLSAEVVAVKQTLSVLVEDAPDGGTGSSSGWDTAHAGNYAGMMAFLDGETYLQEATLDQWDQCYRWLHYNNIGHNARLAYGNTTVRSTALSIPTTNYGQLMDLMSQERNFSTNLLAWAVSLTPDADRHKPFLNKQVEAIADWYDKSFNGTGGYGGYPTSHLNYGVFWAPNQQRSPFTSSMTALSLYHLSRNVESSPIFKTIADHTIKHEVDAILKGGYYAGSVSYKGGIFALEDYQTCYPSDGHWHHFEVSIDTNDIITLTTPLITGYVLTAGDRLYFCHADDKAIQVNIPPEVSENVQYYVQQVSGNTFKISNDQAGSNIVDFTNAVAPGMAAVVISIEDYKTYAQAGDSGTYTPNSDSYTRIIQAALNMGWACNNSYMSAQELADFNYWCNTINNGLFTPWSIDPSSIRQLS